MVRHLNCPSCGFDIMFDDSIRLKCNACGYVWRCTTAYTGRGCCPKCKHTTHIS